MGNEQIRSAIKKLQETQIILSQIEGMQSVEPRHEQGSIPSDKLRVRIEKNLAESREKLDRLIGPQ
jgi:hypothetical protein